MDTVMKKWIILIGIFLIAGCSVSDFIDDSQQPIPTTTVDISTPSPDIYATNWADLISALTAQSEMLTALPTTTPFPITPLEPILLTIEAQNREVHLTLVAMDNENDLLAEENQNLQAEITRLNTQLQTAQNQTTQNTNPSTTSGQGWPKGVTDVVFVEP